MEQTSSFTKTTIPHVETDSGEFLDLTLEKLQQDQRIHYLENFIKGKFMIKGISFNDIINDDKERLRYYLENLKIKQQ